TSRYYSSIREVIDDREAGLPVRIVEEILRLGVAPTVDEAHDIERLACKDAISYLTCPCGSGYISK
ncbi:hypothetical protein HK405_004289, partial [Cladochytrium tenue]